MTDRLDHREAVSKQLGIAVQDDTSSATLLPCCNLDRTMATGMGQRKDSCLGHKDDLVLPSRAGEKPNHTDRISLWDDF